MLINHAVAVRVLPLPLLPSVLNRLTLSLMLSLYLTAPASAAEGTADRKKSDSAAEPTTLTVTAAAPDRTEGPENGYVAEESGVGTKTRTPVLEIPQSVSVVTRRQMEIMQPSSSSAALRYTAGATSERYGGFGDYLDMTRIRGVDADYYLDGLRIISNPGSWLPQIDPWSLERIEVLRGPAAALYGQGTGGGIVNQVSLKPQDIASHHISLSYGSFHHQQFGIDSTGPVTDDNSLLYRFTASGLDTRGQIEDSRHRRLYLAPSVTWRPTDKATWTLMATYSWEPDIANYNSLPAALLGLNNSPYAPLDRHKNYTDGHFADSTRRQQTVSSLFEYQFDNGWTFNSNARYMNVRSDIQRGVIYGYQLVNAQPWLKAYDELTPATVSTFSMDNHISGDIDAGPTRHTLLAGVDFSLGRLNNALYSVGPVLTDPYGPDYRPDLHPDFTASRAAPWREKQQFTRTGVYLQDQIAWNRWRLTLSGRHDWSDTDHDTNSYSPVTVKTRQTDEKWTGRAGLSYQFDSGLAPYISYATSFDPLLGSGYDGKAFRPVETKQSELGIKFHPEGSKTLLSAALFQLTQSDVKTSDAEHLGFNTQAGKARTRGIDLQATTEIVPDLNLIASYTWLDNELTQDATNRGKTLTQVPANSAAAWLDYRFDSGVLSGLQLGSGVRYLGTSYGDPANTFKVPAATLVDVAGRYDLGQLSSSLKGTTLAINVNNLTNKRYVASCTSAMYCFVGQDRTVTATVDYRW